MSKAVRIARLALFGAIALSLSGLINAAHEVYFYAFRLPEILSHDNAIPKAQYTGGVPHGISADYEVVVIESSKAAETHKFILPNGDLYTCKRDANGDCLAVSYMAAGIRNISYLVMMAMLFLAVFLHLRNTGRFLIFASRYELMSPLVKELLLYAFLIYIGGLFWKAILS